MRPKEVKTNHSLRRYTTIRTGGPAQYFAAVSDRGYLVDLLRWVAGAGLDVGVIGSGSNLLVADEGVRGLVIKLEDDLAKIETEGSRLVCGGGARLPQVAARAASHGLAGIEFAVNIPGTVGGAVKMNANAYGGELGTVLEWAEVATAQGIERRKTSELGLSYRSSNLGPGEIVTEGCFHLAEAEPGKVKANLAALRRARKEAQPSGVKTFGSTFKNPTDERASGRSAGELLEQSGCKGLQVGGARFSTKHANFIENTGDAATSDVLELMERGCRRVKEKFGVVLEPEVQVVGDAEIPEGLF